jgi:hypothetical protein
MSLDTSAWCVFQYHRTDDNDGMIMAFRRPQSQQAEFALTGLREIDPKAQYRVVRYQSYEPSPAIVMTGSELLRSQAEINENPGSVLIEYEIIKK